MAAVFSGEDHAMRTGKLMMRFVASYHQRSPKQSLEQWLMTEFQRYPNLGVNDADIINIARDIIANVEQTTATQLALTAHLAQGKSRDAWLAQKMEQGAGVAGIAQIGNSGN